MPVSAIDNDLEIEVIQLKKAALIFRAVNHRLRLQMLELLHQNGRVSVTVVYQKLRLEQSVVSQHLAILRKAGFVHTERQGKCVFYSVNYDRLVDVRQYACQLLEFLTN